MRKRQMRHAQMVVGIGGLIAALASPTAQAAPDPDPITDPVQAVALAAKLGDDRTGGVYLDDGLPVITVTDQAAAKTARDAGAVIKTVPRSVSELKSIHAELDRLAGIPNTAWGIDPESNQVSVTIFDGVSAADRDRIEKVASDHVGAVRVEEGPGKLEQDAAVRGGVGIFSSSGLCSSAFNVQDSSGKKYMLTAGHCLVGGNYDWYHEASGEYIGHKWGEFQDEPGDWAIIEYKNPDITPYGTVQYRDGSTSQITSSRNPVVGETTKRVGTTSQDLVGEVARLGVTVNYTDGTTLYNMIESTNCSRPGDSGGALFTGTYALGIHSGSNWGNVACSDNVAPNGRRSYQQPIQQVIIPKNLKVY